MSRARLVFVVGVALAIGGACDGTGGSDPQSRFGAQSVECSPMQGPMPTLYQGDGGTADSGAQGGCGPGGRCVFSTPPGGNEGWHCDYEFGGSSGPDGG